MTAYINKHSYWLEAHMFDYVSIFSTEIQGSEIQLKQIDIFEVMVSR